MVKQRSKFKDLESKLSAEMPAAFFEKEFRNRINQEQKKYNFSDSTKKRLFKSARRLNLKWNTPKKLGEIYSYDLEAIEELDVIAAWSQLKGCYLSHYSALYFNQLIEQRPNDYFITCERPGKSAGASTPLKPLNVKQAFLKPARKTQNYFQFKNSKFFLLEKLWLNSPGVEAKQFPARTKEVAVRLTSVERTLIDSIISPHYSGGIATVAKAYANTEINVEELERLYRTINPIYPYWQSLGFFLEKLGRSKEANFWENSFGSEKKLPFFFEHEAKSYWKVSERWSVSYPGGVFGED